MWRARAAGAYLGAAVSTSSTLGSRSLLMEAGAERPHQRQQRLESAAHGTTDRCGPYHISRDLILTGTSGSLSLSSCQTKRLFHYNLPGASCRARECACAWPQFATGHRTRRSSSSSSGSSSGSKAAALRRRAPVGGFSARSPPRRAARRAPAPAPAPGHGVRPTGALFASVE